MTFYNELSGLSWWCGAVLPPQPQSLRNVYIRSNRQK